MGSYRVVEFVNVVALNVRNALQLLADALLWHLQNLAHSQTLACPAFLEMCLVRIWNFCALGITLIWVGAAAMTLHVDLPEGETDPSTPLYQSASNEIKLSLCDPVAPFKSRFSVEATQSKA